MLAPTPGMSHRPAGWWQVEVSCSPWAGRLPMGLSRLGGPLSAGRDWLAPASGMGLPSPQKSVGALACRREAGAEVRERRERTLGHLWAAGKAGHPHLSWWPSHFHPFRAGALSVAGHTTPPRHTQHVPHHHPCSPKATHKSQWRPHPRAHSWMASVPRHPQTSRLPAQQ